jgi:TolB protein
MMLGGRTPASTAAVVVALGFFAVVGISDAQTYREPVLQQVTMPHAYYWRGLYLPQLTSGPSAAAFSPDGNEVIYSMQGSLWRQAINSADARELTAGPGYDYQPDWSPDGKFVVFARHLGDAVELHRLTLDSGRIERLTQFGAATVEPRISPDGRRLAFVSSKGSGYFSVYVADFSGAGLGEERAVIGGERSARSRYYYGPIDHAISPAWTPDGQHLIVVSNHDVSWGTGDIWSVRVSEPSERRRLHAEETNWEARPDVGPDGSRILYSSYHGRQWHQLWLTTVDGAPPLPLTFGDFDRRNARWSPQGTRVLYISNEGTNPSLWIREFTSARPTEIRPVNRSYARNMGRLDIDLSDDQGKPISARVSVFAPSDQRHYASDDALVRADDSFLTKEQDHEAHYFRCDGKCSVSVPAGRVELKVHRGLTWTPIRRELEVGASPRAESITLKPVRLPAEFGRFVSADMHVHMNYGGQYRMSQEELARDAAAEDLGVIYNLIVNKEQRVPDIEEFSPSPTRFGDLTIFQGQETHTSYWGHMALLHLGNGLLMPHFTSYQHTTLASPFPHNGIFAQLAREQGALVGYVHPFDGSITNLKERRRLTHTLPVDVALGNVDYLEVVSFANHVATAGVWHRLLNLGFRIPAGAGTDAMANYSSLRGPVGINRAFLRIDGNDADEIKSAVRSGRGFVSNAPLLGLTVNGVGPGGEIAWSGGTAHVKAAVRSVAPLEYAQLVHNGNVIAQLELSKDGLSADFAGDVALPESGWILLRAGNSSAQVNIQDFHPYGTTNPVWVGHGKRLGSTDDAVYFMDWIDLIIDDVLKRDDFNTETEREMTLDYLRDGRQVFAELARASDRSRVSGAN